MDVAERLGNYKSSRLLGLIIATNKAIIRAKDEQSLFNEICRLTVETGMAMVSWIGRPDPVAKKHNPIAIFNATPDDISLLSARTYDDDGPTATVLRTGKYYQTNDFLKEPWDSHLISYLKCRGFNSYLALPLNKGGKTIFTLNIYSDLVDIYDAVDVQFFEGMADDISNALDNLENIRLLNIANTKLVESTSLLELSERTAHTGSWSVNFLTRKAVWSTETKRIYGHPEDKEDFSYADWATAIHPDDMEHIKAQDAEAEKTYSMSAKFHRIIRPDGEVRHVQSISYFKLNEDGVPVGMYGIVHDVTEQKIAEQALVMSEKNLRKMMDVIPLSVYLKDLDGNFTYANQNFCDIVGTPMDQLVTMNWDAIRAPGADFTNILQEEQNMIADGKERIITDFTFTDYRGNERTVDIIKSPFYTASENSLHILCVIHDVTLEKKADFERSMILDEVTRRNKNLEQFSYIISHNLRAPVANILGIASAYNIPGLSVADVQMLNEGMMASATKLDNIIRDLNNILQSRDIKQNKEHIGLQALVNEVMASVRQMATSGITIKENFADAPDLFTVKSYLYSIFTNLITNSIKYGKTGERVDIEITSRQNKNGTEIIFTDHGIGIDLHKYGSKVFGLYNRFHTSAEGSGVGLFLVKTQVEALGGKIDIESEVNAGTTFYIQFNK